MRSPRSLGLPLALGLAAACVQVYPSQAPAPSSGPAPAGATAAGKKPEEEQFKPWDTVLKNTRAIDGLIRTHIGRDQSILLELKPDQLDKDLGLVMHISRGIGDLELHQGLPLSDAQLVRFHRVGDQIWLYHMNPRFTADSGTPLQVSLERNVGHSVIATFKIESEQKETHNLLVNATGFFLSDYADLGQYLKFWFKDRPPGFERERSTVGRVLGFPRNVEIDADLTYHAPDYPAFGDASALSDYRYIPVTVRYSLFALPDKPMRVRAGDDRVGYFLDAVYDFSQDRKAIPFRTMVDRWRLEKKDPSAPVSEPVQPIVYYVDRSVPLEYRPYVKQGIEAWNKAFEAAGFKNAIVAKDAPDNDTTWSAEDIRYSTVRWTASYRMGYAIGPSQTDPRTGEILNADILISSAFPRGWLFEWQEISSPDAFREKLVQMTRPSLPDRPGLANRACLAEEGISHQLGIEHALLSGLGVLEPGADSVPMRYVGEALRELVMHEVGHTLGLRHNFKGSAGVPNGELQDTVFTRKNGVSVSVMDYDPANVSADPKHQGDYYMHEVGSYDVWAIRYGYTPVPGAATPEAELPELAKIAGEAADPLHSYGTDEDNWLGPWAVDPLTSAWELGADPMKWAADRVGLVHRVEPRLEPRLIQTGKGYQRLRGAIQSLIFERFLALNPVTKAVGGLYFARDHKGDPNARLPFTPVSAERQRAAVRLIVEQGLSDSAFRWSPDLLNKLAPNRMTHWGTGFGGIPVEFPANELAGAVQGVLLTELLDPARLARMVDNESRSPVGQSYTVAEMFHTLTDAVWSEVEVPAKPRATGPIRRNLQRLYIDRLGALLLPGRLLDFGGEDARSVARLELTGIGAKLAEAESASGVDRMTQAHLAESRAQVDRLLRASAVLTTGQ
jgi:hypothetical protein